MDTRQLRAYSQPASLPRWRGLAAMYCSLTEAQPAALDRSRRDACAEFCRQTAQRGCGHSSMSAGAAT
eukprot:scaffold1428_cov351-Prasinococcus_capsulatus_cf.AAC.2